MEIEKTIKVKDIMSKEVISVTPDTMVTDVAQILAKFRYHGVPVVENGEIVGVITETDFFIRNYPNLYLPSYIDFLKKAKFHKGLPKKKKKETNKLLKAQAKDIMSPKVVTISEDEDISELAKMYQTSSLYTLPVINKINKLVGIVTQADIIRLIKV